MSIEKRINRHGDVCKDRRRKHKKLRVRVEDSDGSQSDESTSD